MSRESKKHSPVERMCKLVDEVNRRLHAYSRKAECFCGRRKLSEGEVDEEILDFIETTVNDTVDNLLAERQEGRGHNDV